MIDPVPPASPPKKRRRWLRRFLVSILALLVIATVFHRPLIRFIAIRIAARQHLSLDFRISGSLFTNLVVEDIRASPSGTGTTPVEKIAIKRLRFDYSLPMLAKHGVGEFLRSYEVRHAELVFVAVPSKSQRERKEKISVAQQLRVILAQPAAYADRAEIENFNVRVRSLKNETIVEGIDVLLAPDRIGHLRIRKIAVPGLPVWENLSAETSYEKRNLFIKNLAITPEIELQDVNFDASERAKHRGNVSLKARVFGGDLALATTGSRLDQKGKNLEYSYATHTTLSARGIRIREAAEYFGAKKFPVEVLGSLDAEFTGEPEKPRTWTGTATASVERIAAGPFEIEQAGLEAKIETGKAETTVNVALVGNTLRATVSALLPETINEFDRTMAQATVRLDAPELAKLSAPLKLKEPLSGTAQAEGRVTLRDRVATANLSVQADSLAAGPLGLQRARVNISATKQLGQQGFLGLASNVRAELDALRFGTFTVDTGKLEVANDDRLVTLKALDLVRGENSVTARGTWQIPTDWKEAARTPIDTEFTIKIPDLAGFGIVVKEQKLAGRISAKGAIKLVDGAPTGGLEMEGSAFQLGTFVAERLGARLQFVNRTAQIEELALRLNAEDGLAVQGHIGTDAPHAYDGTVTAAIKDLAVFQPLLEVFGINKTLAGSLAIDWRGKGALKPADHGGELKLDISKARYGTIDLSEFRLAGLYGPEFAKSTEFRVSSGVTRFAGTLDFSEGKLRLRDIDLQQGAQQALTGFIILPFALREGESPIRLEERIAINVNANNLDLDKLLTSFGQKSPVSGNISASLVAGGTGVNPAGQLQIKARALKADAFPKLDNAEVDLTLHYANKKLEIEAAARQREIQPLTLRGVLPLDLEKVAKEKGYDPLSPLDLTLKLPPSSLTVLPKYLPAVRRAEGTLGADLRVGGTLGKPEITLALDVAIKGARMTAENVPAIGDFEAKVTYANETLTFTSFKGGVGGGTFRLGGNIKVPEMNQLSFGPKVVLPKAIQPIFDLRLESDEVLVLRNDAITVRADTDLKLIGPLQAAAATGTIYITHSRFFKEIDILPIALPGRPKPAPKSAPRQANISFPNPPLRDWKFDIAIKTRPDDPFLIRGNLANGSAALDLRFLGTGLKPWLDGNIRIEQFKANLPFSTLSVTRGFIYFKEDAPFQPTLDLQAESRARDYLVTAYIYGNALSPQIQLSSEPPLQHADIVSLLATGTTTAELGQNAEALASKAALLAVKQLWQKMFKRKGASPPPTSPTDDTNLMQRFDMEIGATDNRTGRQQVVTRFKINDQLYLIGDADVDGEFTGRLKYLIRFR